MMLILKGGNDFHGVGLLEVEWKVFEEVLDGRLKEVEIHDSLHEFW